MNLVYIIIADLVSNVSTHLVELVKQFLEEENFPDEADPVTLGDGVMKFLLGKGVSLSEGRSASYTVEGNFKDYNVQQ